jgi:hypothetical protein
MSSNEEYNIIQVPTDISYGNYRITSDLNLDKHK